MFDQRSFETGVEFKKSIEDGLDDSGIFVLFASKASLQSVWVDFEINEAWWRKLERKIGGALVFIIDSSVDVGDLPPWLRRSKAQRVNAPQATARVIRDHIDEILRHQQHSYFVGRGEDVDRLQQVLTPWDGSTPPHVVIITGLPGIGKRTLLRHVAPFTLNLLRLNVVRVEEGDELPDLASKLADQIEPFSTAEGFKKIVAEIRAATDQQTLDRIVHDLQLCIANHELPVLFDDGGLLDEEGRLRDAPKRIIAAVPPKSDTYLFIVSNRRPNQEGAETIPGVPLKPLRREDTKSLIAALANRKQLQLKVNEIAEISEYAEGFPPACGYAVQLAVDYGVVTVLQNKHRLVEFRTLPFIKYLSETKLTEAEKEILRILAEYSPLPLAVIGEAVGVDSKTLSEHIIRLIDYSLISPAREGFYSIADPIRDAVVRLTRLIMSKHEHSAVANSLKKYIDENEIEEHAIDAYRVLFRAARNSGDPKLAADAIYLANDVIQLLERSYHARDFEEAIRLGREAVAMRPRSVTARSFLIRAFIQEAMWPDAEQALTEFELVAPPREVFFLKGFMKRKQGDVPGAIALFHKSERAGRRGAALMRELAWCYSIQGDLDNAAKYLEEAIKREGDNPFVVDLGVQIATRQGDERLARRRLELLKEVESPAFYHHRLSHVEAKFGNFEKARAASQEAMKLESKPTFEMIAQYAVCELRLNHVSAAEKLAAQLERDYSRKKPDFRLTLRAMIEVQKKHFGDALALLERHSQKTDRFYMHIAKTALEGELASSVLTDETRANYQKQVRDCEKALSDSPQLTIDDLLHI